MRVHPGAIGRPALQCLLLGHDETTSGGCARPGCQTTGLDERAEQVARLFHEVYEGLAPAFDYETREASAVPWAEVPVANKRLMVATAAQVVDRLKTDSLETAALAFILELSEAEPSGGPDEYGLTAEVLVARAGEFLREHGLQ